MVEFFGELKEKLGQVQSPGKYIISQVKDEVSSFFLLSLFGWFFGGINFTLSISGLEETTSLRLLALAAKGTDTIVRAC